MNVTDLREELNALERDAYAVRDSPSLLRAVWNARRKCESARDSILAFLGAPLPNDECEFLREDRHSWFCTTHDRLKIAGTTEPNRCR